MYRKASKAMTLNGSYKLQGHSMCSEESKFVLASTTFLKGMCLPVDFEGILVKGLKVGRHGWGC